MDPLRRSLVADPLPWSAWLLAARLCSKIKSRCLGHLFRAPGLYLGPQCTVRGSNFIRFGSNVYVHGRLWIEAISHYRGQRFDPLIEIGDDVGFSEGVHISCIDHISIGDGALIGSHVYISDHNHGSYRGLVQSHPDELPAHRQLGGGGPVEIGKSVLIGDNVVIVGPISIGRGSIIGANSVVRSNIPEQAMAVGTPARVVRLFNASIGKWERV